MTLPKLHTLICGHIHAGYGSYTIERPDLDPVTVLNVAQVNEAYEPVYNAVVYLEI
jgi:hypothetical protein